ncbi:MAG: methyltransferase [Gammaproteobacteria bacterium]|nr:methyltransferase [Gammaproteobacteria bacterium]
MDRPVAYREAHSYVEASLTYCVDTGEKPVIYPSEAGGRSERCVGQYANHTVALHNGRFHAEPLSLDREGFLLSKHETRVQDFYDEEEVRTVYESEIERLIKELSGATKVVVFDHTRRADAAATREQKIVREPARMAHSDYTERSAPQRIRDLLPAPEAEQRLKGRFAIINIWRPMRDPVQTVPLAVCDARTIAERDLVVTQRRARDRIGEIYQIAFNPDHCWFYFPYMQRNEALVFKCFDSAVDGRARFAPHTAFDDPTSPPDAPARESIEARTIAFFQ